MKTRLMNPAVVLGMLLTITLLGCEKDNSQELKDREARLLKQYLEENNITVEPTSSGLYYLEIEEGTGTQPADDYLVDFDYTIELIDETVIGTSDEELAQEKEIYSEGILYGPVRVFVGYSGIPGLNEGLKLMKEGGKATLILPSSINGLGSRATALSPSYSTHIYTIELINAFDDPDRFQTDQIAKYLVEQGIDSIYITESGLHFLEQSAGTGELIKNGDKVDVWYTGGFLDGRVFDSNLDGQVLTVDVPADNLIPGWNEALKLMREGGKAMIIIPYELAYGLEGRPPLIPPYKTLVFDLEIQKVYPF
jgi:FKBP-type peptidyl-prolyl cis-trans isomerase